MILPCPRFTPGRRIFPAKPTTVRRLGPLHSETGELNDSHNHPEPASPANATPYAAWLGVILLKLTFSLSVSFTISAFQDFSILAFSLRVHG